MKLKLLTLIPLLLLSGCSNDKPKETYINVYYEYSYVENAYVCKDLSNKDSKTWKVKPENFYYVYVLEYKLKDETQSKHSYENYIADELFVYASYNKLYVYQIETR